MCSCESIRVCLSVGVYIYVCVNLVLCKSASVVVCVDNFFIRICEHTYVDANLVCATVQYIYQYCRTLYSCTTYNMTDFQSYVSLKIKVRPYFIFITLWMRKNSSTNRKSIDISMLTL